MGDGSKRNNGITLCTDSFTLEEVILLINILILKFNISPTLHRENKYYRIYINNKDMTLLLPSILPHYHSHFLYKFSSIRI
jgi:hypothetical protein